MMTQSPSPILYSFRRCPYAMRARMALWSSGITVEMREIVLGRKPASLLAVSPKGTVPVLDFGEGRAVIEQSLEIMLWALEQSDPAGWLSEDRGASLSLIARNDGEFKRNLDRYKYPERHGSVASEARDAGLRFLEALEAQLEASLSPYLFGVRFTLADAAIFPFIRQFANVDSEWFASLALPRLRAWLSLCLSSEVFEAVMQRLDEWSPDKAALHWGRVVATETATP